ncbi:MMPL family transporter [Sporosarcina sp. HYO08]|uniref:MMPL family transporter n=1 Tax=Sporosarcina sp. HYO08 TaxID=1759557 RepID=UPI0007926EE8|nr:MMPL family transporter [Sporosarcina sp. HYO08]KXH87518.1 hypothetical protein AU377_02830 [Sporosarcina sp. HYO08]
MLKRLASLLQKFPMKSIFITVIVIILLASGVRNVRMATGNDTLVNSSTDVYKDNVMLEKEFGGESIIVLYESDQLLTPENLAHMKGLENALKTNDSIYSIVSPVTLVEEIASKQAVQFGEGIEEIRDGLDTMGSKLTEMGENLQRNPGLEIPQQESLKQPGLAEAELPKMGGKLQTISENMHMTHGYSDIMTPGLPTKQATLDNIVYDEGKLRPMFEEVIVDDRHMLMMIRFKGNTADAGKSEVVATINDYLHAEKIDTAKIIVSGKPVLDNAIRSSMQDSMKKMLVLALTFMVIVLFLVFNVSWRLLSLATVLVAVIATIGTMGWLNIPITMVSMAVFPILIGLGIDYGIQFQNRYNEEMTGEEANNDEF